MNARELAEQTRIQFTALAERLGSNRAAVEHLEGCGLSTSWLFKFLNGEMSNPTVESLATLQEALTEADLRRAS